MGVFPKFLIKFLENSGSVTLYPYGTLTSCKKLEKTNEQSLRYLKTDQRTTDGPRADGRTRAITKDLLRRTRGPKYDEYIPLKW